MDININERVKYVWDNMVPDSGRHMRGFSIDALNKFYDMHMLPNCISFKDKTIVNYGCGGGWLEKRLFEKHGIKKSLSMDIASKSVEFAKDNLKDYNANVYLIEPYDYMKKVKRMKKDIFMSCECIQHFPTKEYFDGWLEELNSQKYEWIVLHYKTIDGKRATETTFLEDVYVDLKHSNKACVTESKYIKERLTNYKLMKVVPNRIKPLREAVYFKYDR